MLTLAALLLPALLIGQQMLNWPGGERWSGAINNSFHALLFFLVTPLVCLLLRALGGFPWRRLMWLSASVSLFLAVLTEALQFHGPRDASFLDVVLDTLGAAAALALLQGQRLRRARRTGASACFLLSALLLLAGFSPLLYVLVSR